MALLQAGRSYYFSPLAALFPLRYVFEIDSSDLPQKLRHSVGISIKILLLDIFTLFVWLSSEYNNNNLQSYNDLERYAFRLFVLICIWMISIYLLFASINYKTKRIDRGAMQASAKPSRQPLAMSLPFIAFLTVFALSFPLVSIGAPQLRYISLTLTAIVTAILVAAVLDQVISSMAD